MSCLLSRIFKSHFIAHKTEGHLLFKDFIT